jgi:hypothetical protein
VSLSRVSFDDSPRRDSYAVKAAVLLIQHPVLVDLTANKISKVAVKAREALVRAESAP